MTESVSPSGGVSSSPVARKNFIDEFIFSRMERDGVPHAPLATDAVFYRRVHIDLTGRIPDPNEAKAFVASPDPAKRDQLIDELVNSKEFRERWTYWFLDNWRASQNRIGVRGRNLFHEYVYDALQYNQPFDELVRELITAKARSNWYVGPASYLVRWVVFADSCVETMHEDTADEMTVNLFKNFMGVNLQCVSCHDGRNHLEGLNLWLLNRKREQLWQQAAFFGNTRVLRRVEIDNTRDEYLIDDPRDGYSASAPSTVRVKRKGEGKVEPAFIFGGEKPRPGKPLREELARIFTSHPQFARATVNMFWAELMGVGIVDPPWEFDLARLDPSKPPPEPWGIQPTHPELLEALAKDFQESGYNLRHLVALIARSSAYQLSSEFPDEWKEGYTKYFARHFVRRMSATQVYDAIVKATGLETAIQVPGTDIKVNYMVQTRGPYDAAGNRHLDRELRRELEFFFESFGQPNREFNEPSRDGSIIQAVLLMNSPFVKSKVQATPGGNLHELLQDSTVSDEQLIDQLFWSFLTRDPSDSEERKALALLADRGRRSGAKDLQWLLTNKVEFLFHR